MGLDRTAAEGGRVIVAGVDGSDSSWRAVAYAVGLARRQNALLVLVHVLPVHPTAVMAGVAWMLTESDMTLAKQMQRRVAVGLGCMSEAWSLRWEFQVVTAADPVAGLSRVAEEVRADTVVVGASERLWHRVAGSTGVRMVKSGRWPVVVVP